MRDSLVKYQAYVVDFLNEDTLKAIDYGILDLSKIRNYELKQVLTFFENLLTTELERNYMHNNTGIFRVSREDEFWCYCEVNQTIKASSVTELKEIVLNEHRIWYVFDEMLARKALGR